MPRAKKNGAYLNVCIETAIYNRLEALCLEAGQTRTIVVESALFIYLNEYQKTQEHLKIFESTLSSEGK